MSNEKMESRHAATSQTVAMSHERLANLFLIDLFIGTQAIPFVFDTGASMTVISESVSKLAGAAVLGEPITGGGNANARISASKALIASMRIGEIGVHNLPVSVLPDASLDFGLDEEGRRMIVHGLLGWDVIQHFKWTLDCLNRVIIAEQPIEAEAKGNLFWDNMPIITAVYNNQELHFGFDSGNTESMFSQNFIPLLRTKQEKTDTLTGVDGTVEESVYVADHIELMIDKTMVELNHISVLKRDIFPARKYKAMGLLAADIIQNRKCIIDSLNNSFEIT